MKRFRQKQFLMLMVLSAVLILIPLAANSAEIGIAVTGQTTPYDAGDDGTLQMGVSVPSRFVQTDGTCADGTTGAGPCAQDMLTGLIWPLNGNLMAGPQRYDDSLTYVMTTMTLGGQTDWRIPNMLELMSMTNAGEAVTATWLNADVFSGVQADQYWSSNAYGEQDASGCPAGRCPFFVNLGNDFAEWDNATFRPGGSAYVFPVRGGANGANDPTYPANLRYSGVVNSWYAEDDGALTFGVDWPVPRFEVLPNSTIIDHLTDFQWTQDARLTNAENTFTVQDALTFVDGMNTSSMFGTDGWRLSNRRELHSLIYWYDEYSGPDLEAVGFIRVGGGAYWTSTANPATAGAEHYWWGFGGGGNQSVSGAAGSGSNFWALRDATDFPWLITVGINPPGGGTVVGSGDANLIDCPVGVCLQAYNGTMNNVILTATPAVGSIFEDWTGCDNPAGNVCTTSVDVMSQAVYANFRVPDVRPDPPAVISFGSVPVGNTVTRKITYLNWEYDPYVVDPMNPALDPAAPFSILPNSDDPDHAIAVSTCYNGETLPPIETWTRQTPDSGCPDWRRGGYSEGSEFLNAYDATPLSGSQPGATCGARSDFLSTEQRMIVPGTTFDRTLPWGVRNTIAVNLWTWSLNATSWRWRVNTFPLPIVNGNFYGEVYHAKSDKIWWAKGTIDYRTGMVNVEQMEPSRTVASQTGECWRDCTNGCPGACPVRPGLYAPNPPTQWYNQIFGSNIYSYDYFPNNFALYPDNPGPGWCTVDVEFTPTSEGESMDLVNIPGLRTVALHGIGTAAGGNPDIAVSDYDVSLYNTQMDTPFVGTVSGTVPSDAPYFLEQTITVTNEGTAGGLVINSVSAPLSPLFTIPSEDCTGLSPLAMGATCEITARYTAPSTIGIHNSSFTIASNDPDEPIVTVNLNGSSIPHQFITGNGKFLPNHTPNAFGLLFPANGAEGVQSPNFFWEIPDDIDLCADVAAALPEGCDPNQSIHETLWLADNPSFSSPQILGAVESERNISYAMVLGNPVFIIALFGLVAFGVFLRRRKIALILVAVVFVSGLLLIGCGGHKSDETGGSGGVSGAVVPGGLQPGTTYYWKVVADDNIGGVTESYTWSFTTAP